MDLETYSRGGQWTRSIDQFPRDVFHPTRDDETTQSTKQTFSTALMTFSHSAGGNELEPLDQKTAAYLSNQIST